MLLEFSRDYIEQLGGDKTYCHPYIRCQCGSDKVFSYGLPKITESTFSAVYVRLHSFYRNSIFNMDYYHHFAL
jgi:hypothetical protein